MDAHPNAVAAGTQAFAFSSSARFDDAELRRLSAYLATPSSGINMEEILDHITCHLISHHTLTWSGAFTSSMRDIAASVRNTQGNMLYHGPEHSAQVALMAYGLSNHRVNSPEFTGDSIAAVVLAAAGHDLCHDGRGNAGIPFRLEARAAQLTGSILRQHAAPAAIIERVEALILATDAVLRKPCLARTPLISAVPSSLQHLTRDIVGWEQARILSDADLFCSLGVSPETALHHSTLLARERSAIDRDFSPEVSAHTVVSFLDHIGLDHFLSRAAQCFRHEIRAINAYFRSAAHDLPNP